MPVFFSHKLSSHKLQLPVETVPTEPIVKKWRELETRLKHLVEHYKPATLISLTQEDLISISDLLFNQIHYFEENYSIPSRISKIKLSQISTMRLNNHELLNKLISISECYRVTLIS